jgi:hypothetical protein
MPRLAWTTTLALLSSLTSEAAAQRRKSLQASDDARLALTLNVSAEIGGKTYQASGAGSCRHAPEASIRGVSASMWMVEYGGGDGGAITQLNLTLWRPKDGSPDQVSLALDGKGGSHRVETGSGEENRGEAAVVILPNGPGGRFEIKGKNAAGKRMQLTIECPAFTGVEAEGG